jgi:Lrp/AsnC family transcriptional regulator, regulator for asnA, asnC and gidA
VARDVDALDKDLIANLSVDGRVSLSELAERTGVSRPTAAARVRALTQDGVLRVAGMIDAVRVPGLIVALVGLTVDKHRLDEKVEQIAALPEVTWAAVVTGRYDILAEVVSETGMSGLYGFLNVSLREVGGINASEMFVVMKSRNRLLVPPRSLRRAWAGRGPEGGARGE